jgi:afadin
LLRASKASINDITDISSSCYKLNSIQLRALLNNYIPDVSELPISSELIERAVAVAQNTADALARKEGASGQITLMEDSRLQLPFLLPEDGYSCDFIKGLNNDVLVFVQRLEHAG